MARRDSSDTGVDTMKVGLNDLADTLNEVADEQLRNSEAPQVSVNEKVIFCIDKSLLHNIVNNEPLGNEIFNMLRTYFNLKKKISMKPVNFDLLLIINNHEIAHVPISQPKDISTAFLQAKYVEKLDEDEPFNFDKLFTELANMIPLPDPNCCSELFPPACVYHAILLFGQNKSIPVMEDTNAFDFLMMTPYFALDVLYIYDTSVKKNRCEQISEALQCLNENHRGYYYSAHKREINNQYSVMSKFLGHPLIRFPQNKIKYDIEQLGPSNGTEENADH